METPEAATEIVADVAEEVVEQAAHLGRDLGLVLGGLTVGAGLGGALGFIFTKRKLETKYSQLAADEIADMRDHYNAKLVAQGNTQDKGSLDEIVKERGYVPEKEQTTPPMAVTPPSAVVDRAAEVAESEDEVAGEPPDEPVDEAPEPVTRNVFRDNVPPEDTWDYHKERSRRTPFKPFVIHIDEREDNEAHEAVSYTYYEADDVVCNERDEVMPPEDRERIIGEANLEKFGHGSDDINTVYVRNPQLEMDMEIVKSPNSFAEEVHGFDPKELKHADRRRGKTRFDDD